MEKREVPKEISAYLKILGENFRKLREEKNLSLREIAAILRTDHSMLNKLELNGSNITMVTLIKLAKLLKVQPRDLLNFDISFDDN